ncbi:MAG: FAD:protein FMN transferase [Alphaproteobacteria bacterium]|nr:FAD:protein FMN transferase [Alphaproteobacteria bacterium]
MAAAAPTLTACTTPSPPEYASLQGKGLGTSWTVRWSAAGNVEAPAVEDAVLAALRDVDEGMSTWRDDSDLAAVRRGPGAVAVRADTAFVVRQALALAEETGGAFDPTVQPLVELWGLHGAPRTTWPSDEELGAARAQLGWARVAVTDGPDGAAVDAGGTALDLSAIAKGHAVDRVVGALGALGVTDLMVEVGGEVRAHGRSPRGGAWVLGVDRPVVGSQPGEGLVATVRLANAAMATSGNYRTAYEVEGRTVHHTLDPRTGLPASARVLSATVVAPDCRTADGWATALMVLGPEEGLPLLSRHPDLEAWVVVADGDGWRTASTPGMDALLASTSLEGGPARD